MDLNGRQTEELILHRVPHQTKLGKRTEKSASLGSAIVYKSDIRDNLTLESKG